MARDSRCGRNMAVLALAVATLLHVALPIHGQDAAGKKVALLVGVNEYDRRGFRDLEFAERDVQELAKILQPVGYEVHLLTGSSAGKARATLKNIQATVDSLLKNRTKHDLVLIGLAGHGLQIEVPGADGKLHADLYFCPCDVTRDEPNTMFPMGKLFEDINRRGGGQNLVLVDACREDPTRGRGMDGSTVKTLPEGMAVLFGCRAGEKTVEHKNAGGGHGVFFHFVLEGLRGMAANEDGEVTWSRLTEYVSKRVKADAPIIVGNKSLRQTPNLIANLGGDSPVLLRIDAIARTSRPSAAQSQEAPEATMLYRRATTFYKQGEWELAEGAFKELVTKLATSVYAPESRYFLGVCQVRQNKQAEAIKTFQEFIKLYADSKRLEGAYTFLAQSQLALGQKDVKRHQELLTAAIATYTEQLKKWPSGMQAANAYFSRGDAHFALGNKDEALKDFTAVVEKVGEKGDKFAEALYSVGYVLQEQQKWEAAAKSFADFLMRFSDEKPKHALLDEVRMRYGETMLERQQFSEAEKWLQMAAETENFKFADHATKRWAESNAVRKKHAEAAKLYLSIPEKFPTLRNVDPTFCHLEGARNAYLARQFDLCRAASAKVIPLRGVAGAEAAHWTARSWLSEKKAAEALKTVEAALPKAAGTKWEPDLMLDRGDAMLEIPEKRKTAPAAFYAAYVKSPTHTNASQALYNAAFAAMSAADYTAAVKYAQEFRAKFTSHGLLSDAIFIEAESHMQLKDYAKAVPLYTQMLKDAPQHRHAQLWKTRLTRLREMGFQ